MSNNKSTFERVKDYANVIVSTLLPSLAVSAVPVGKSDDGLTLYGGGGSDIINNAELRRQANTLNKTNALYKRALGTVKAYVLGNGFSYHAHPDLTQHLDTLLDGLFIDNFLSMAFEELMKSGDLFVAAHVLSDNIELRIIPTHRIVKIVTSDQDYATELEYHEQMLFDTNTTVWLSWKNPKATSPLVFHLSINNDAGELFGTGEFATSHVWMNRYAHLLKDRVHVNVALKSFFWMFSIPDKYWNKLKDKFSKTPQSGSTLVLPQGVEAKTVSPDIGARDFKFDRIAILEMASSGTTGLSPLDFGELETSNLATAKITSANKSIIMRRLQRHFFDYIQLVLVHTINVYANTNFKLSDLSIYLNSIDHRDVADVIAAGLNVVKMYEPFIDTYGETKELKMLLLNLFVNVTNTPISPSDFNAIIDGKTTNE